MKNFLIFIIALLSTSIISMCILYSKPPSHDSVYSTLFNRPEETWKTYVNTKYFIKEGHCYRGGRYTEFKVVKKLNHGYKYQNILPDEEFGWTVDKLNHDRYNKINYEMFSTTRYMEMDCEAYTQ